ncbi:GAF domain-containing sensor histidine kinase [Ekhidna sp.]
MSSLLSSVKKGSISIESQYAGASYYSILTKISSRFLNDELDNIKVSINDSLKEMCLQLGADRMRIHEYHEENELCILLHQWYKKNEPSICEAKTLSFELVYRMISDVTNLSSFISDVDQLPLDSVKSELKSQQIKSILFVPVQLKGKYIGFISVESVKKTRDVYENYELASIELFANMVANFLVQSKDRIRLEKLIEKTTVQNKRHTDFSFITSHNIRASVANLVAITDLLNNGYSESYMKMLQDTVSKLNTSLLNVNEILNEDHNELLKRSECKISRLLNRLIVALSEVISENEIDIENRIPDDLVINVFPGYLDNVFYQLLTNCIKYGVNDESKKIVIKSKNYKNRTVISFVDYGKGIDLSRYGDRIFEVGSRFHTESGMENGLGLFVAKKQIESLGGDIELHSELNKGTTVKIIFPKED